MDFSAKKIFTVANGFSALRILLVPVISWLLFIDTVAANLWAGGLLMFAIATDFLDGFFARLLNQVSDLGKIIDPLADKLFIIAIAVVFIFQRNFPVWLAAVILVKDLLIVGASVIAASRTNAVMSSNVVGKYAFAFQAFLIFCYYLRFPFGIWSAMIITLALIFWSLVSYGRLFFRVLTGRPLPAAPSKRKRQVAFAIRWTAILIYWVALFFHAYWWATENSMHPGTMDVRPLATSGEDVALARRHAPVLKLADGGARPVVVEDHLTGAVLMHGSRHIFALMDSMLGTLDGGGSILPADEDGIDTYIVPSDEERGSAESAAYFAVQDADDGRTVIHYWFLFPRETAPVWRTGDWQAALLFLDSAGMPDVLTLIQGWQAETRAWSEVECIGDRPVIHVGLRSNGFYFERGRKTLYLDQASIFPVGTDTAGGEATLSPDAGYKLHHLSGEERWLSWHGFWGGAQPAGDRGPRYWNAKSAKLYPWSDPWGFMLRYAE